MGKLEDIEARLERVESSGRRVININNSSPMVELDCVRVELNLYKASHDSAMQGWGRCEQERDAALRQMATECAAKHGVARERDAAKSDLRDAEERASGSLRLWQEFAHKLDEKYPGRDKGEDPDDYALRLLVRRQAEMLTLDRILRDTKDDLERVTRDRNDLLMARHDTAKKEEEIHR